MTSIPVKPAPRKFSLAQRLSPPDGHYQWVHLWGAPIRIMHWLAAFALLVLAVTGLYIGKPFFISGGSEAADPFMMGWVRFFHFAAAAVLVMTAIVRVYWLFAGNRFERLRALFPIRWRDWVNMVKQAKFYMMIAEHPPHYLGHNPMQQLSYTGIYLVALLMVVTGFAMYGQSNPGGIFYRGFNWVGIVAGGMPVVRLIHHAATWVFLIFIPIHVYLAFRADNMERSGVISSIITGGRFVPDRETYIDGEDE